MKYFFIKLIAISIIVCTTQYGYYFFLSQYFPSIKKTNITFQRLQESLKQKPDIVFCGSSTNFSGDKKDKDIRKISEFLAEELPACKIVSVSWIAYTIEIFNKIVKYTNKHNKKPTQFIIELSLPTFSKSALEPSNTTYLKENEIIFSDDVHSAFFHPLSVFKYKFNSLSQKEFNEVNIYNGVELQGKYEDLLNTNGVEFNRNMYLINYLDQLDIYSHTMNVLKELIDFSHKNDISILYVIYPIDYLTGKNYFPETFEEGLDTNISSLTNILEEKKASYLDLSKTLESKYFVESFFGPTGHLDEYGRKFVAQAIAKELNCLN